MQASATERGTGHEGLASRVRRLLRRPAHLEPVDPESWYVVLDAEFHGPIARDTLAEVLAEHTHDEDAPLWSASHADEWTTMREVPGLADEVAACRAQRARAQRPSHPPEPAVFAASKSEPPPPPSSLHSGEIDVAAALRALSATNAPVAPELLASAALPPPARKHPRRHVPERERRAWLGAGIALGGVAVAAFMMPFVGPASRPLRPSPPDDLTPCLIVEAAPATAGPTAPIAAPRVVAPPPPAERDQVRAPATSIALPRRRAAPPPSPASAVAAPPPSTDAPAAVEPSRPARSLEELLVAAVPILPAHAPPSEVAAARVVPTDAEVVRALDAVRDEVLACTPVHAVAALRLTFDGSTGRVHGVYVDGVFSGTPAGSCIARAIRRAHVPPFSQDSFAYSYPYRL